jgi:hypothetical protein
MFRFFPVQFDRFLSALLRRTPGKIFLSFSIIREYLSDSQRILWIYHYSMIATLEIRVLISGSASFSEKVDRSSSPDRLQVAALSIRSASSMICVIIGFQFSHPPLTGLHRVFLPPPPVLQSTSLGTSLTIGRSQKKLRLEKYSRCFHILKHFPFLISTIRAQACSTLVRCSLNNFGIKASIIFAFRRQQF